MAYLNIALLAAVLPAAFAMPQHAHMGHGPYKARQLPSGFPTGFPHPSGIPGSAPFPVSDNGTAVGPTGTGAPLSTGGVGAGPVTIQSTISIVPLPASTASGDIGNSPTSGAGGVGSSPASGSAGSGSSPSGAPGSGPGGPGESGATCARSTVTVTRANTITVTVAAPSGGSAGAPSDAAIQSSKAASSPVLAPSSAPFPIGNSSVPVGPTGTGTGVVGTGLPSVPYQAPIVSSTPVDSKPVSSTPVNSTPVSSAPVAEKPSEVVGSPAPVSANSVPVQAYSAPAQAPTSAASSTSPPTPGVVAPELVHVPGGEQIPASPVVPASVTPASVTPAVASSVTPVSSTAGSARSLTPVSSNGKARGLLYAGHAMSPAEALSAANSYVSASKGAMGWCWDWDSSPSPAIGWTVGTTNVEFVPMLWGLGDHVTLWSKNVAALKPTYVMGFNEPDMTTDKGGSQLSVGAAVQGWKDNMEPLKSSGIKLVTPGTTNELTAANMGHGYMSQFLESCSGCHFDALTFHYYGEASDISALKAAVTKYQTLQQLHNIPELWISEMAPNEPPTPEQMSAFLKFLDDPANGIARYAFNGLNTGNGQSLTGGVVQAAYQA